MIKVIHIFVCTSLLLIISLCSYAAEASDFTPNNLDFNSYFVGDKSSPETINIRNDPSCESAVILKDFVLNSPNFTAYFWGGHKEGEYIYFSCRYPGGFKVVFSPSFVGKHFEKMEIKYRNGSSSEIILKGEGLCSKTDGSCDPGGPQCKFDLDTEQFYSAEVPGLRKTIEPGISLLSAMHNSRTPFKLQLSDFLNVIGLGELLDLNRVECCAGAVSFEQIARTTKAAKFEWTGSPMSIRSRSTSPINATVKLPQRISGTFFNFGSSVEFHYDEAYAPLLKIVMSGATEQMKLECTRSRLQRVEMRRIKVRQRDPHLRISNK